MDYVDATYSLASEIKLYFTITGFTVLPKRVVYVVCSDVGAVISSLTSKYAG